MKRILAVAAVLILSASGYAQVPLRELSEPARQWKIQFGHRQPADAYLPQLPQAPQAKDAAKSVSGMPDAPYWFPGEWEEVQAVVVTPIYDYYPVSHVNDEWYAVPMVPGYGYWYQVNRYGNWQQNGGGDYVGIIDTASTFGAISFSLMDAIQQGGAEAWVRVEKLADSAVVLRTLAARGMRTGNIRFFEAPGNLFWYRDCGPICFYYGEGDTIGMLDFEYNPARTLDDSLPTYIERHFGLPNFTTTLEWEGGNCLVDGAGMLITSSSVYSKNTDDTRGPIVWDGVHAYSIAYSTKPRLTQAMVRDTLRTLVGTRELHVLPAFRYDGGTGHVDLYADMLDENQFVFSQMPDVYSSWTDYITGHRNVDSICSYSSYFDQNYYCNYIPFPSKDDGSNFSSQTEYNGNPSRGIQGYTRSYSNHTFVNNLIIQPCFSSVDTDHMPTAEWDRANVELIKQAYPGYTLYCVDVRPFDGLGGAIHCITKQIPAAHPIRILHQPYHGAVGTRFATEDAPLRAEIHNVDGIQNAKVVFRFNHGTWQEQPLTLDSDGRYAATLPTAAAGVDALVEYYISATSFAGKTITKPITAPQGGYYTFTLTPVTNIPVVKAQPSFGQLFPNPATQAAHISIDLGAGTTCNVSILDLAGRTLHTTSFQAAGQILFTLQTSHLAAGQYMVVFDNGSERVVRKLIVK